MQAWGPVLARKAARGDAAPEQWEELYVPDSSAGCPSQEVLSLSMKHRLPSLGSSLLPSTARHAAFYQGVFCLQMTVMVSGSFFLPITLLDKPRIDKVSFKFHDLVWI